MVGWTLVSSVALVLGVGVSAEAAGLANLIIGALAILGHANIKTPRWLGYVVQRPENHAAHHERGVHAYNYADISLFDMVFGTFKNPESFPREAGFFDGASHKVANMLLGRDISGEPADGTAVAQKKLEQIVDPRSPSMSPAGSRPEMRAHA
jgi:sterol desaturase/sphingolipid hydroxylase (fatty acid hydroxylase superfamily)